MNTIIRGGHTFVSRPEYYTDEVIYDEVFSQDCYRWFTKPLVGKKILDLGANVGVFSVVAAKENHVTAVEPEQNNLLALYTNMKLNNVEIDIESFAVGSPGVSRINDDGGCSVLSEVSNKGGNQVEVKSLDQVIGEGYDFVKIDIEGSEYGAVLGASDDTLRKIKSFAFEVHPDLTQPQIHKAFIYRLSKLFSLSSNVDDFYNATQGIMLYGELL